MVVRSIPIASSSCCRRVFDWQQTSFSLTGKPKFMVRCNMCRLKIKETSCSRQTVCLTHLSMVRVKGLLKWGTRLGAVLFHGD